ncbi:MAG: hypothetical protein LUD53_04555 [Clostridiales bacterium]|nr:hypothetical protein [Clostridiales bacterium]
MRKWKQVGGYILLAAVLATGYLLPYTVNAVQDHQINGKVEIVRTESTQLQMSSDLTLNEKFLVIDRASSSVDLESAQNMEYESATARLWEELELLFPQTAGDPFQVSGFSETEYAITLCVYEEKSVLLWDFLLENEAGDQMRIYLDDDSGRILSFRYLKNRTAGSNLFETIERTGGEASAYLDDLAVRYVEYLQTAAVLGGTEISYEWAWASVSDWMPDAQEEAEDSADGEAGEEVPLWTGDSLWRFDAKRSTGSTSALDDESEDDAVQVDQWCTDIHFSKNGEEYIMELVLDRTTLSIHGLE